MIKPSWGTKRTCTCGIRFYDLNKKEIECPGCGENINVAALSVANLEDNLRKKVVTAPPEEKVEDKKQKNSSEDKINEKEDVQEVLEEENENLEVEEIIGDKIEKKDEEN